MKAILRYFGSKWGIADWIVGNFPPHTCYVDLFGGSGAVLLNKPVAEAEVYNDVDLNVFNFFQVLRDEEKANELIAAVSFTPYHYEEYKKAKEFSEDEVEQGRRFLVRQNMCISPNSKRWGRYDGFRRYKDKSIQKVHERWNSLPERLGDAFYRLKNVTLENDDAIEVAKRYDAEGTLFYVDPPYMRETRYHGEYDHDFTDEQHEELLSFLREIRGMVAISGYDCELYNGMLEGWRKVTKKTSTNKGGKRVEVLWMNYEQEAKQAEFDLEEGEND